MVLGGWAFSYGRGSPMIGLPPPPGDGREEPEERASLGACHAGSEGREGTMRNSNKSTTYTYMTGTTYTYDTTLAKRIRLIRQLYTYM